MDKTIVLVVEDDEAIRGALADALQYSGYETLESATGEGAVETLQACAVDLVLLDVMLPGIDGFATLDRIRAMRPLLPVIMVTARGAEEDRVRGLADGADDYVVKPFSAREVIARVEAVLRRASGRTHGVACLQAGGLFIDLERRTASWPDGTSKDLTEREVSILRCLHDIGNRAAGRDELLRRVWRFNPSGVETRTVDMHMARLRDKLEKNPPGAQVIVTVRGKGYRLADGVGAVSKESGEQ